MIKIATSLLSLVLMLEIKKIKNSEYYKTYQYNAKLLIIIIDFMVVLYQYS